MAQEPQPQSRDEIINQVLKAEINVSTEIERVLGQVHVTVVFSEEGHKDIEITQWLGPDHYSSSDDVLLSGARFLLAGRLRRFARRLELEDADC